MAGGYLVHKHSMIHPLWFFPIQVPFFKMHFHFVVKKPAYDLNQFLHKVVIALWSLTNLNVCISLNKYSTACVMKVRQVFVT
uniref:Uncharacterized protein n=1 Tax=Rhizophora mucronata TaxID=61149 RepID=A0A2P2J2G4_RHIMU